MKVLYPQITVRSEAGEYLIVNISEQQLADPLFWATAKDIAHAKLWVPLGHTYHQLLADDWVLPQKDELALLK
ncbi:hypothetical protein DY78_GL000440 [Lactiplantibacillus fabifermentans DSM 21115]|uniref:Uncharacterized protein n=1 Tax=Lactiplantibacillus fabifermentans DSM 21115 TaxID=1413187 RepID=A0A0R2NMP5_9LACO|nr:hypothetical protein DY78_GL000440 [Lactiplantibacillus fabifermentans DSM 21115]